MYACPDHPSIQSPTDGKCPLCNRTLLLVSLKQTKQAWFAQWQPAWVIVSIIAIIAFATSWQAGVFLPTFFIAHTIAGLFIASSTTMLLHPAVMSIFANNPTDTVKHYGYGVGVLELLLAIAYLTFPSLQLVLVSTWIIIMLTSVLMWFNRSNKTAFIGVIDNHKLRILLLGKNLFILCLTLALFL